MKPSSGKIQLPGYGFRCYQVGYQVTRWQLDFPIFMRNVMCPA
ncbi:hypothetical protein [Adhaeribacter arboris]|nr:hypothetical protein [Adhaeribacter arboris]